jgi:hypothetical protein
MALNLTNDLDALFSVDEFCVAAKYIDEFGAETGITVIFDKPYSAVDSGFGEVAFSDANPSITAKSSDCTTMKYGERIEIDSVVWLIREIMPDFTGVTEITLERQ